MTPHKDLTLEDLGMTDAQLELFRDGAVELYGDYRPSQPSQPKAEPPKDEKYAPERSTD